MIYKLKITSWADRSHGHQSGATHYFGSIRKEGASRFEDPAYLTHQVEIVNPAYADSSLRCMRAKPGEMMETNRFETIAQLRAAAKKWMALNTLPGDTLEEVYE